MLQVVNVVASMKLSSRLDLELLSSRLSNIIYNPKCFSALILKNKKIKATALVFSSGKCIISGIQSFDCVRKICRQFARLIQKQCYSMISIKRIKIMTSTWINNIQTLNRDCLINRFSARYNPEIFPGIALDYMTLSFIFHHTGKVIITGVKSPKQINQIWSEFYYQYEFERCLF